MTDQIPTSTAAKSVPKTVHSANRFSILRAFQTLLSIAFVIATLFTLWMPGNLFSNQMLDQMMQTYNGPLGTVAPTLTPNPRPHIGLISGHLNYDPGSVCPDGLEERQVNYKIANLVLKSLVADGYEVDLLGEFDPRITGYQGLALVSIHNDSCEYLGVEATGFKVAANISGAFPDKANRLGSCLIDRYQKATGLRFHANTITIDMTDYHAFREINQNTPAAIIETGFLNQDRDFLVNHTDKVAQGIHDGLLCYIKNESLTVQTTQTP